MLRLTTPIKIGSYTYNIEFPAKGSWDYRTRRLEFVLALAEEEAGRIRVAREVDGDQGKKVLPPPAVLSFTLQDNDDPVIAALFQQLTAFLDALEQFIEPKLAGQIYELGEEQFSLEAAYELSVKGYENERPTRPVLPEEGGR